MPNQPLHTLLHLDVVKTVFIALTLPAILALSACQGETPPAEVQPIGVTIVTVARQDVPVTREFVGKTQSSRRVQIRSRVEGFLERRVYKEGGLVQEGELLFQMDRKPFEAQLQAANAELAQQRARLRNASANLNRIKPLAQQNAVAKKELDDAEAMYRSAAAAVEAAKANVIQAELELSYTRILSPVTGLASFAKQQDGAYIGIGTQSLLTYVAQLSPMWVEFSISENQTLSSVQQQRQGLYRPPDDDNYVVEVILADGTRYPHTGRITFADAALSEETGTFLLRATVDNPGGVLRPGQFVRAHLKGAVRPDAILVPQSAVQQGAKGSFVWVVDDRNIAHFRPIILGDWHGDQWFVNSGLQHGDHVVVDGAIKLRAGAQVSARPHSTEPQHGDGNASADQSLEANAATTP